jgi:hypothetical protein
MLYYDISDCFMALPELGCIRYGSLQIVIHATIQQTILGVCILYAYLHHFQKPCDHYSLMMDIFHEIIIREVWYMPFTAFRSVSMRYIMLEEQYHDLIMSLLEDERTQQYCQLLVESLHHIVSHQNDKKQQVTIGHEDVVRLRNCLIRIQNYARKSYIPSL